MWFFVFDVAVSVLSCFCLFVVFVVLGVCVLLWFDVRCLFKFDVFCL